MFIIRYVLGDLFRDKADSVCIVELQGFHAFRQKTTRWGLYIITYADYRWSIVYLPVALEARLEVVS